MLHQAKEIGKLSRVYALFIQRQDEIARFCLQRVIGILDTFGNATKGEQFAKRIFGQKGAQGLI